MQFLCSRHLKFFGLACGSLFLLLGTGCQSNKSFQDIESNIVSYKLSTSLVAVHEDGTETPTGLIATWEGWPTFVGEPHVVISPNERQVVWAGWDQSADGIVIHLSDLDGNNSRVIAEQEVGDGNGGLIMDSIRWSEDGKSVYYTEGMITCEADCSDATTVSRETTYQIDLKTGEKSISSVTSF